MSASSAAPASSTPNPAPASAHGVPFVLYALRGRVYASNVKQKLIDLGEITRGADGQYSYLLDGDKTTGSGFDTPEAALAHVAAMVSFLFLDGQFTALEDLGGADRPDLVGAPQLEVMLEPPV